jgi:hypothetical protein
MNAPYLHRHFWHTRHPFGPVAPIERPQRFSDPPVSDHEERLEPRNRFVAIVPDQGSAYYREPDGGLIQVAISADRIVTVPEPGAFMGGNEAEVDWFSGFGNDRERQEVRAIERALEAIPDDLATSIAQCRFSLTIELGGETMGAPAQVAAALRTVADSIESTGKLTGAIRASADSTLVGNYTGWLPSTSTR